MIQPTPGAEPFRALCPSCYGQGRAEGSLTHHQQIEIVTVRECDCCYDRMAETCEAPLPWWCPLAHLYNVVAGNCRWDGSDIDQEVA